MRYPVDCIDLEYPVCWWADDTVLIPAGVCYFTKPLYTGTGKGIVFITVCLVNGKKYIGQHRCTAKCKKQCDYLGSGSDLKNAIKKYGRERFKRFDIAGGVSEDRINSIEAGLLRCVNAGGNHEYYNRGNRAGAGRTLKQRKKKAQDEWDETADLFGPEYADWKAQGFPQTGPKNPPE